MPQTAPVCGNGDTVCGIGDTHFVTVSFKIVKFARKYCPVFSDSTVFLYIQCDQPKEGLMNNTSQIDEFCKERGFIGWFETSAKENINIDEAARFLVTQVSAILLLFHKLL